ncbi:MAG: NADH-quinone oxidoreductase subunit J [Saprospiraceae bacterium]|nr:NADH-quinone oxidoreductase subunit J [Saprospiraceae bacterium]MCF8248822.1 NADH-quinone oxidoreductase subunit J [Saprospiraceae bacterium]MCF8279887.1 NADH-quinone oxidoreductase subunit J [Bacteroidales bacterium]MCF8310107.1 NADH-quinone oxidoreductase subunit J [Saprospiraceae bacterium]MCF8439007.1 NADH-quinone oxidoreductase subunit J [Saprospiraceae bacterium]
MPISEILFWFLSAVAVLCAMLVVAVKNPIHSALFLILTFFAIAGHYFLLNAHFLAAVHIIVYAGAIMVLFLYIIMMVNLHDESGAKKRNFFKFVSAVSAGLLLLVLTVAGKQADLSATVNRATEIGTVESLGHSLFNEFLLPFEISALLFLSAMVGAVLLSKKVNQV